MIILDTATKTLDVVLGDDVTTHELPVVASYVDIGDPNVFFPGSRDAETDGDEAVSAVFAPPAGIRRQVKFVSVCNVDTVAADVTVQFNNNGTVREVVTVTLDPGYALHYVDGTGFYVLDSTGARL